MVDRIDNPEHYVWFKREVGVEPHEVCAVLDAHSAAAFAYMVRSQFGKAKVEGAESRWSAMLRDTQKARKHLEFREKWIRKQLERDGKSAQATDR